MTSVPDDKLGEALWMRAQEFHQQGDVYNALLDAAAAHRLLTLAQDERSAQVWALWNSLYKAYTEPAAKPQTAATPPAPKDVLNDLLSQVQKRKQKTA